MFKYLFLLLLSFNILNSNEDVVKTSELELFLFKIGFESLLKDVDINKDKTSLNEQEIKTINEKIELIMAELYKDKRVLFNDSEEKVVQSVDNKELQNLKAEIALLKEEVLKLKETKKEVPKVEKEVKKVIEKNKAQVKKKAIEKVLVKSSEKKAVKAEVKNSIQMRVATPLLDVYKKRIASKNFTVRKIKHNEIINIDFCKNGWCKLTGEKNYVREFLIKPWKI